MGKIRRGKRKQNKSKIAANSIRFAKDLE